MKKIFVLVLVLVCLTGCAAPKTQAPIAATTAPVQQFAAAICEGTGLEVGQIISDAVSCLHDYSLSVRQMEKVEGAELVLLSGAGLEEFMEDVLTGKPTADCAQGVALLEVHAEDHGHEGHSHEHDPHIWLDPDRAAEMAENICHALCLKYPAHAETFCANTESLTARFMELKAWGQAELENLTCREIITFHDGFAYLAEAFDLQILEAIEEEAGSEASAAELCRMIDLVREYDLPCVFTEKLGSVSAASVISAETGCKVYALDMAMAGDYFEAMEQNIITLKEALS